MNFSTFTIAAIAFAAPSFVSDASASGYLPDGAYSAIAYGADLNATVSLSPDGEGGAFVFGSFQYTNALVPGPAARIDSSGQISVFAPQLAAYLEATPAASFQAVFDLGAEGFLVRFSDSHFERVARNGSEKPSLLQNLDTAAYSIKLLLPSGQNGYFLIGSKGNEAERVYRLSADGAIDPAFAPFAASSSIRHAVVDTSGRLVISDSTGLTRLDANGAAQLLNANIDSAKVTSIAALPGNRIAVTGWQSLTSELGNGVSILSDSGAYLAGLSIGGPVSSPSYIGLIDGNPSWGASTAFTLNRHSIDLDTFENAKSPLSDDTFVMNQTPFEAVALSAGTIFLADRNLILRSQTTQTVDPEVIASLGSTGEINTALFNRSGEFLVSGRFGSLDGIGNLSAASDRNFAILSPLGEVLSVSDGFDRATPIALTSDRKIVSNDRGSIVVSDQSGEPIATWSLASNAPLQAHEIAPGKLIVRYTEAAAPHTPVLAVFDLQGALIKELGRGDTAYRIDYGVPSGETALLLVSNSVQTGAAPQAFEINDALEISFPFATNDLLEDAANSSNAFSNAPILFPLGASGRIAQITTINGRATLIAYDSDGERYLQIPYNLGYSNIDQFAFYELPDGTIAFNHAGLLSTLSLNGQAHPIADDNGQPIPAALHIDAFSRIYAMDTAKGGLSRYSSPYATDIGGHIKIDRIESGQSISMPAPSFFGADAAIQWKLNGVAIPGENQPWLSIPHARASQSGVYSYEIFNQGQRVEIAALDVTVDPTDAYLSGLSLRGNTGESEKTLISGYSLETVGFPALTIVRSLGPNLLDQGVENALSETKIDLYANGQLLAGRAGDHSGGDIAEITKRLGLQPLLGGSKDTALLLAQDSGLYGALSSNTEREGVSLTELYLDRDDFAPAGDARYRSLSGRGYVTSGEGVLIAGFAIEGAGPKTVLIRAAGPVLAEQGVISLLADPQITLYQDGHPIASNDDWIPAETQAESARIGAQGFVLGSKDAALIVTLQPGNYGAVLSSSDPLATGVAMVEIYDLDD